MQWKLLKYQGKNRPKRPTNAVTKLFSHKNELYCDLKIPVKVATLILSALSPSFSFWKKPARLYTMYYYYSQSLSKGRWRAEVVAVEGEGFSGGDYEADGGRGLSTEVVEACSSKRLVVDSTHA